MPATSDVRPVIIIGAPRSGTNMLRDVLVRLPTVGTWPCDEINYIWRHGNMRYPSDELPPRLAHPRVRSYIRRCFARQARRREVPVLVEKTCANSLRVGFVREVVPEARYVFIVRDGMDVVRSALERWRARLDVRYHLLKARFVPPLDLPYYAARFLGNRLHRTFSSERRLAFWGPRLDDMDALLARHSLEEISALQWCRCVESAERELAAMPGDRVHRVRYEQFVREPVRQLERIVEFLGVSVPDAPLADLVGDVTSGSVGRGRAALGPSVVERLLPLMEGTLRTHGYA